MRSKKNLTRSQLKAEYYVNDKWHGTRLVWDTSPNIRGDLKPVDLAILLCLIDHRNDDTEMCFPSQQRLASKCWCSESTVHRSLTRLREAGLISWFSGGSGWSNEYTICFEILLDYCNTGVIQKCAGQSDTIPESIRPTTQVTMTPTVGRSDPPTSKEIESVNERVSHDKFDYEQTDNGTAIYEESDSAEANPTIDAECDRPAIPPRVRNGQSGAVPKRLLEAHGESRLAAQFLAGDDESTSS